MMSNAAILETPGQTKTCPVSEAEVFVDAASVTERGTAVASKLWLAVETEVIVCTDSIIKRGTRAASNLWLAAEAAVIVRTDSVTERGTGVGLAAMTGEITHRPEIDAT